MNKWEKISSDEMKIGLKIATLKKGELQIKYAKDIVAKDQEIAKLNNTINTILDYDFFEQECPMNYDYQEGCAEDKTQEVFFKENYCETCDGEHKKCWLKYFKTLQELKGSDKE